MSLKMVVNIADTPKRIQRIEKINKIVGHKPVRVIALADKSVDVRYGVTQAEMEALPSQLGKLHFVNFIFNDSLKVKNIPMNNSRNDSLQRITWAMGTLRSAVTTINIGEDIEGCQNPVKQARDAAKTQINRIRVELTTLESLIGLTDISQEQSHDSKSKRTTAPRTVKRKHS